MSGERPLIKKSSSALKLLRPEARITTLIRGAMEADDLPPPLEDMTAQLKLRQRLAGKSRPATKAATKTATKEATKKATKAATMNTKSATKPAAKSSAAATKVPSSKAAAGGGGGFAGFSKGFLSSKPAAKPATKPASRPGKAVGTKASATTPVQSKPEKKEDDIPFIRASNSGHNTAKPGLLSEVQEAMDKAVPFLQQTQGEWMNEELLKKIASSPFLAKSMQGALGACRAVLQPDPRVSPRSEAD